MQAKILTWLFFSTLLSDNTFAHEDKEAQEEWSPVSAGPVTAWTAPLCGKGKFVVQPFFFYNKTRGAFNSSGHYNSLSGGDKKYQYQEQLFMQYGISDNLEIDAQTVYQQNYIKQAGIKAHSTGLGDSYLFLRHCFFEEHDSFPHLVGLFQTKFPTGKYQNFNPDKLGTDLMGATSGPGSYDQGLGLMLTKKLQPFIFHLDTIYSFVQKVKIGGVKTKYANYLNYDFGLEYFLPSNLNLMLEGNGFLQGDKREDGIKVFNSDINYFTAASGIGWSNSKIQTLVSYQRVLLGTNVDANDSVIFTFVYTF